MGEEEPEFKSSQGAFHFLPDSKNQEENGKNLPPEPETGQDPGNDGDTQQTPPEMQIIRLRKYGDPEKTAERLINQFQEDDRILYTPGKKVTIVEDIDTPGVYSKAWTSCANPEVTITIAWYQYIENNEDFDSEKEESDDNPKVLKHIDWINRDEFRDRFAPIMIESEEDIRILYAIITDMYTLAPEPEINYEFGVENTVNMTKDTIGYWRTIPGDSLIPSGDIKDYSDKAAEILEKTNWQYGVFSEVIIKFIKKNYRDIRERMFRNEMFRSRINATEERVTNTINQINDAIIQNFEEKSALMETKAGELQAIMNENHSNLLAISCEQHAALESSKEKLSEMMGSLEQTMETANQKLIAQGEEIEGKLEVFKQASNTTLNEVLERNQQLKEYKGSTELIEKEANMALVRTNEAMQKIISAEIPRANFCLAIPDLRKEMDVARTESARAIEIADQAAVSIRESTEHLSSLLARKMEIVAVEDAQKFSLLKSTALNLLNSIQRTQAFNSEQTEQANKLVNFYTELSKQVNTTALAEIKGTDFSPCLEAIEKLKEIDEKEKETFMRNETKLATLYENVHTDVSNILESQQIVPKARKLMNENMNKESAILNKKLETILLTEKKANEEIELPAKIKFDKIEEPEICDDIKGYIGASIGLTEETKERVRSSIEETKKEKSNKHTDNKNSTHKNENSLTNDTNKHKERDNNCDKNNSIPPPDRDSNHDLEETNGKAGKTLEDFIKLAETLEELTRGIGKIVTVQTQKALKTYKTGKAFESILSLNKGGNDILYLMNIDRCKCRKIRGRFDAIIRLNKNILDIIKKLDKKIDDATVKEQISLITSCQDKMREIIEIASKVRNDAPDNDTVSKETISFKSKLENIFKDSSTVETANKNLNVNTKDSAPAIDEVTTRNQAESDANKKAAIGVSESDEIEGDDDFSDFNSSANEEEATILCNNTTNKTNSTKTVCNFISTETSSSEDENKHSTDSFTMRPDKIKLSNEDIEPEVHNSIECEQQTFDDAEQNTPISDIETNQKSIPIDALRLEEILRANRNITEGRKKIHLEEGVSPEDRDTPTYRYFIELANKLTRCNSSKEVDDLMQEVKSCEIENTKVEFKNSLECDLLPMIILGNFIIPPAKKLTYICGFPGCKEIFIKGIYRTKHWTEIHKRNAKTLNITDIVLAYLGVKIKWVQESEELGQRTIDSPCICPFCTNPCFICGDNVAFKKHLENTKDPIHQKCNELRENFSLIWAVILASYINNYKLTPGQFLYDIEGMACPYCTFTATTSKQIEAHVAGKHREKLIYEKKVNKRDKPLKVKIYSRLVSTNEEEERKENTMIEASQSNDQMTAENDITDVNRMTNTDTETNNTSTLDSESEELSSDTENTIISSNTSSINTDTISVSSDTSSTDSDSITDSASEEEETLFETLQQIDKIIEEASSPQTLTSSSDEDDDTETENVLDDKEITHDKYETYGIDHKRQRENKKNTTKDYNKNRKVKGRDINNQMKNAVTMENSTQIKRKSSDRDSTVTKQRTTMKERINNQNKENFNETRDNSRITMEEVRNALDWRKELSDCEFSFPRFRKNQRSKIEPLIKDYWKNKALPQLTRFANNTLEISDEVKWEAIDGLVSKIEFDLADIIKQKLKLSGKRKTTIQDEEADKIEIDYSTLSRYKTATANAANILRDIHELRLSDDVNETYKTNKLEMLKDRCLSHIRKISETATQELFNKIPDEVNMYDIDRFTSGSTEDLQRKISWLSNSEAEEGKKLDELSDKRKKVSEKRAQELYAEDPKRAFRWYVLNEASPACPIPIDSIEEELSARWISNDSYRVRDETTFRADSIPPEVAEDIVWMATDEYNFKEVIKSRSKQSSNGPDGIGYSILQMDVENAAKFMALLSKTMFKYKRFPSRWLTSRSILLYKHGDPNELSNWRPLTISSCMYRTWACAVAAAVQNANHRYPLFMPQQKGFISGVNGCLEHTVMINEIVAAARRDQRNLYMITIDLKDAFGSLPHGYIKEILKETGFTEEFRKTIMESYHGASTKFWVNGYATNEIQINKGVKQGCPFSPLLFNLCLNPLIRELDRSKKGFLIGNNVHTVQAYADDIILFSETREDMMELLRILESFIDYSRLEVNNHKCHSLSYVIRNNVRVADMDPFTFNGSNIPVHNLAESLDYLGTKGATTINIRREGTTETITTANERIDKVFKSPLKLNQMIDAVKRFIIPSLDYTLTEGAPKLNDLTKLDTKIRNCVAKHIGCSNIPISVAYTHWKDGGLSLQPLNTRAKALRVKSFVAMMNSGNKETKNGFRECVEQERIKRDIEKVPVDQSAFLDWKTDEEGNLVTKKHGTSALCAAARKAASALDVKITYENDKVCMIMNEEKIKDSKEITRKIIEREMSKAYETLCKHPLHGHSFLSLKDNKNSNSIIGNYSHNISDKMISFALAGRINNLATGNILNKKPNHDCSKDKGCPYCGIKDQTDTLNHRLNGCKCDIARKMHTIRHNKVCDEIVKACREKFPNGRISVDRALHVNDDELAITVGNKRYRPDIFVKTNGGCHIIEVTVPYDNVTTKNNKVTSTMEERYNAKMRKYEPLRKKAKEMFHMNCTLTTIVVSSLGVLHRKSMRKLNNLLDLGPEKMNTLERRISVAAIIGSFLVFYRVPINRRSDISITDEAGGDPNAEEPDHLNRISDEIEDPVDSDDISED